MSSDRKDQQEKNRVNTNALCAHNKEHNIKAWYTLCPLSDDTQFVFSCCHTISNEHQPTAHSLSPPRDPTKSTNQSSSQWIYYLVYPARITQTEELIKQQAIAQHISWYAQTEMQTSNDDQLSRFLLKKRGKNVTMREYNETENKEKVWREIRKSLHLRLSASLQLYLLAYLFSRPLLVCNSRSSHPFGDDLQQW